MKKDTKKMLIIGALVVAAVVVIIIMSRRPQSEDPHREDPELFTTAGALDHIGSLLDDQYDLVQAPDMEAPAAHFADLVSEGGDHLKCYMNQPDDVAENLRPMERLQQIQGEGLMPRTSLSVTPYNIDVANPSTHKYMVGAPRVQSALKSRLKDYGLSGAIRGDIPIKYHPNVCMVGKSIYGRDDLRLDGLFTPHFVGLYNKYTGKGFKNMPIHVASAGSASCGGYGGAAGEIIMDNM